MSDSANQLVLTQMIWTASARNTVSSSIPPYEGTGAIDERYLRNAAIIDQNRINAYPVTIIGVGAIGSHLAEILAKLGVRRLTLIDPDEVDTVNLSAQGFYEAEVGQLKTLAVANRLRSINRAIEVHEWREEYKPEQVEAGSIIFSCVDSIKVRRAIFRDFRERDWPVFLDGRMSAESLQVFCIDRSPAATELYRQSLFPSHEAHRESCTAKTTIYCATLAAAILCAQFKKWAMGQTPEPRVCFDLFAMDCFR